MKKKTITTKKIKREKKNQKEGEKPPDVTHMVDRECRVEKAPGAMLEILLS